MENVFASIENIPLLFEYHTTNESGYEYNKALHFIYHSNFFIIKFQITFVIEKVFI